jgi:hypothetical protein
MDDVPPPYQFFLRFLHREAHCCTQLNDQLCLSHHHLLGGDKDGGGKSSSNDENEEEDENHDEDDNDSESGGLGGSAACGDVVTVRRLLADGEDVEQRSGKVSAPTRGKHWVGRNCLRRFGRGAPEEQTAQHVKWEPGAIGGEVMG